MANDIKKEAAAQRAKQEAPQPRPREEGGSLSDVVDQLKKGNSEQSKTTEANVGLVANMVSIANAVESSGLKANAALDGLADSLLGNKLKDLEKNKEDAARDDKTNELLEELVENTDQSLLESPKGFFGTALAVLGGLTGALAGLLGGFALGVFESIKLMSKGFKTLGGRIFTFIDDLFGKNISKGLTKVKGLFTARVIDPVNKFFKGIKTAFNLGNKGLKTYKASLVTTVANFFGRMTRNIRLSLGGIGDSVKGLFTARVIDPVNKFFKGIKTAFNFGNKGLKTYKANLVTTVASFFGNVYRSIRLGAASKIEAAKGLKSTISGFFSSLGTRFTNIFKGFKLPMGLGDDIKKAGDSLKSIKNTIAGFVTPFTKTASQASKLKNVVLMAISPFKLFKNFFDFFSAKFGPLGKVLGKLFLPVTIIMGIFDGIKGAISGAEEESGTAGKFVGGLMGAISGILVGLVGMPLDLLKDLVSWIAGKMGMDGASEFLDSFSFSAIIGGVFDVVKDFFMAIVDFFTDLFSEGPSAAFGNLGTNINELFKKILRSILPDPSVERAWYNPIGFIQRAIPDGLYEYAGMDPKTGEIDAQYKEAIDAEVKKTGEDLNAGSIDAADSKNASQGVTANTVVDSSSKRSSNQTINIMGPTTGLATANELRFQG